MSIRVEAPAIIPMKSRFFNWSLDMAVRACAVDKEVSGLENLEEARKIISRGLPLFMMGNHLSYADIPLLEGTLSENGFNDMRERLVYLLGHRTADKPVRFAYSYIHVWPPTMKPQTEEEMRLSMALTQNALSAVPRALSEGKIIVAYAEGGRSKDTAALMPATPQVAHYLTLVPYAHVLPFAQYGTESILPPGEMFPPHKAHAGIAFGKSVAVAPLFEQAQGSKREKQREVMDTIYTEVALLLKPPYRGVYSERAAQRQGDEVSYRV